MKSEVYKLNVDKLVPVSVDLSKLSDAIKKDVDNAKIKNIENKIMLLSMRLKINEVKNKKASIDNLATNHSLNAKIN